MIIYVNPEAEGADEWETPPGSGVRLMVLSPQRMSRTGPQTPRAAPATPVDQFVVGSITQDYEVLWPAPVPAPGPEPTPAPRPDNETLRGYIGLFRDDPSEP